MNEKINLKQIERKAYTSYHQDGIIDILIAVFILSFAALIITDMIWLGWMFFLPSILIYGALKKVITVPRIGFVKFSQHRTKIIITLAVILGVLGNVLGLITFIQVESGSMPVWLLFAIENYMLAIGISVAVLFSIIGFAFRVRRMYAYGLLTLLMFVSGHFIYYPLQYYLLLLGTLTLLSGSAMLIRFVRRYSLSANDTIGDGSNEEPQI
jgi:hypothetical protein